MLPLLDSTVSWCNFSGFEHFFTVTKFNWTLFNSTVSLTVSGLLLLAWPYLGLTSSWLDCFSALNALDSSDLYSKVFSPTLFSPLVFGVKAAVSRKIPRGEKRQRNVPEVEFERKNKKMRRIPRKECFCLGSLSPSALRRSLGSVSSGETPPGLQMISGIVWRLIVSTCGSCSACNKNKLWVKFVSAAQLHLNAPSSLLTPAPQPLYPPYELKATLIWLPVTMSLKRIKDRDVCFSLPVSPRRPQTLWPQRGSTVRRKTVRLNHKLTQNSEAFPAYGKTLQQTSFLLCFTRRSATKKMFQLKSRTFCRFKEFFFLSQTLLNVVSRWLISLVLVVFF